MTKRPILTILFASITFIVTLAIGIFTNEHMQVSLFNKEILALEGALFTPIIRIDPEAYSISPEQLYTMDENVILGKYGEWTYCQYDLPSEDEEVLLAVDFQSVTVDESVQSGQVFLVDMELTNSGNTRLFNSSAGCWEGDVVNVGTQKEIDRASYFGGGEAVISGWISSNRIKMVEEYVDPGETFHVQFQSVAPDSATDDIYREWFQPVIEDVEWVGETFPVDIVVGEPTESMYSNIEFAMDGPMAASELEGLERSLEISLADQEMYALMGDTVVWTMKVSTGASATPTPRGTYEVLNKQELRIGGASPHYRMPYWQGWRSDGYGLHALPYLATDGGAFWYEALDHIGIPVSHGCIRMLPDDAEKLYGYTEIGTELYIH